jgi:hypothetical protein
VVQPRESFWTIAEQVLSRDGTPAGEAEVRAYWRELVDANRDRLRRPGDPDHIETGQELVVPAPRA